MSGQQLVHVRFRHPGRGSNAGRAAARERAAAIAATPGLLWKIWTYDPDSDIVGGTYLFHDVDSARAYLDGPIVSSVKAMPGVSEFSAVILTVNQEFSATTRAPLEDVPIPT